MPPSPLNLRLSWRRVAPNHRVFSRRQLQFRVFVHNLPSLHPNGKERSGNTCSLTFLHTGTCEMGKASSWRSAPVPVGSQLAAPAPAGRGSAQVFQAQQSVSGGTKWGFFARPPASPFLLPGSSQVAVQVMGHPSVRPQLTVVSFCFLSHCIRTCQYCCCKPYTMYVCVCVRSEQWLPMLV